MSIAEFEEKEFEGPLNGQLGLGGPIWSPGQVLEEAVGFDVAIFTVHATFWASCGFTAPPQGAVIYASWWPGFPFTNRSPPTFRVNVFLQYKRPEYLSRSSASEWSEWKSAYYRFWITDHQQTALDACAASLGQNGYVAYASPAFHTRAALFDHVEKQTLILNTHFAPATKLSGHGRYTYVSTSAPGKAHSEPTDVEPLSFFRPGGNGDDGDGPPQLPPGSGDGHLPERLLAEARKAAEAAVAASPALVGSAQLFDAAIRRAISLVGARDDEIGDAVRNYVYVAMFSLMSGIRWCVWPPAPPSRTRSK